MRLSLYKENFNYPTITSNLKVNINQWPQKKKKTIEAVPGAGEEK